MKFTLLGSAHFTQLPFLDFLQSFTENKKVDWSNRLCKIFECRQTNGRARSWCTIEILLSIHPLTFLVHLINDAKAFFFFDQVDVILFSVQKQNNLLHFVANSFFADIVIVFDIISYFPYVYQIFSPGFLPKPQGSSTNKYLRARLVWSINSFPFFKDIDPAKAGWLFQPLPQLIHDLACWLSLGIYFKGWGEILQTLTYFFLKEWGTYTEL